MRPSARLFALVLLVIVAGSPVRAADAPATAVAEPIVVAAHHDPAVGPPADPAGGPNAPGAAKLRDIIGQMIVIGFPGTLPREEWPQRVTAMISAGTVGGVILFGDNVTSPSQVRTLTGALKSASAGLAPFICIDQEGGQIQRLPRRQGFVGLPSATAVSGMSAADAYRLYRQSANELAGLGINVNLGPVVDLNVNPRNPAIGLKNRTYGTDPTTIVDYALQFIDAHDSAGVLTVIKHFPGHGSAVDDPHVRPVDISSTWSTSELDPYRDLIDDHFAEMVMVGHLYHPLFSDGDLPASLSRRAITDVLRGDLGFRGLVMTDDLQMGAVSERFSVEQAAVLAVGAGADLLIVANQLHPDATVADRIVDAVSDAVSRGQIPAATIEDAYQRIVAAKTWLAERRTASVPAQ